MTTKPIKTGYSRETVKQLFALVDAGKSMLEISRAIGVDRRTVLDFVNRRKEGRNIIFRGGDTPLITGNQSPIVTTEELWRQFEDENEVNIQRAKARHTFDVEFDSDLPIGITFMSDQHISRGQCDMKQMRHDAELIQRTEGLYVIMVGDGVDNHVKISSAMAGSTSNPSQQYRLFDFLLGMVQEKILVLISGNHDDWTPAVTGGIDVLEMLAANRRIMYAPDEARVNVKIDGNTYRIAARHQHLSHSQQNQTHGLKRWWKEGYAPFDIGNGGHTHTAAYEKTELHGGPVYLSKNGSYQRETPYSRSKGFNPTEKAGCPTFILYPGTWRITGCDNLIDGAETLEDRRRRYKQAAKVVASVPRSLRRAPKARRVQATRTAKKRGRK